jgi:hypothetical protein
MLAVAGLRTRTYLGRNPDGRVLRNKGLDPQPVALVRCPGTCGPAVRVFARRHLSAGIDRNVVMPRNRISMPLRKRYTASAAQNARSPCRFHSLDITCSLLARCGWIAARRRRPELSAQEVSAQAPNHRVKRGGLTLRARLSHARIWLIIKTAARGIYMTDIQIRPVVKPAARIRSRIGIPDRGGTSGKQRRQTNHSQSLFKISHRSVSLTLRFAQGDSNGPVRL